jgi:quercetin dioxygenase-like cupin family protein
VLKAPQLEVVRIVLHAGQTLREHAVDGEITVLCLEGRIVFTTPGAEHPLAAGDFIHLARGVPHALHALADASALLTICIAR